VAEKLGFLETILKYEEDTRLGYLDNREVARGTAALFKGISITSIKDLMRDIPRINNISPVVSELKQRGIIVILASIQWSFLVEPFAEEYGFDSCCGTKMKIQDGILIGEIESFCTARDKQYYLLETCKTYKIPLSDTVAVGDSKSDHPVFQVAGRSIALNADEETKNLATYSIETNDLSDILPLLD